MKRETQCEKKFSCPSNCGALIVRARALTQHYTSVHKENRKYFCTICEVFFLRYIDFGKHSESHHWTIMWESQHYTTRVYREGIDTCEPVFKKLEVKKSEALKRKGVNGVNDGAAKKRVKKSKAVWLLLAPDLRFLLVMLRQLFVWWKTLRTQ